MEKKIKKKNLHLYCYLIFTVLSSNKVAPNEKPRTKMKTLKEKKKLQIFKSTVLGRNCFSEKLGLPFFFFFSSLSSSVTKRERNTERERGSE